MNKFWKRNNRNNYEIPPKPERVEDQLSQLWDALYNHIPGRLCRQDNRMDLLNLKLNFLITLVALLLAAIASGLFF